MRRTTATGRDRDASIDGTRGLRATARRRGRRRRLDLERLDSRVLPAIDVTAFNVALGTVTFTGDRNGTKQDSLVLSETTVGPDVYLTHNLLTAGGNGKYADAMDIDPGNGIARIKIGTGTSPLITVSLGNNTDRLTLANGWTFNHKVSYAGGAGNDTLVGPDAALTWNLTGASSGGFDGNITNTSKLVFTSVNAIQGGTGVDTIVGRDAASTWTLAGARTYVSGGVSLSMTGLDVHQGGTGVDTFAVNVTTTADLKGGGGNDVFLMADGVTLTGSIAGEGGTDTLDRSAATGTLAIGLTSAAGIGFSGTATGVSGGFSGIDAIAAGSGTDTLTGAGLAATWSLSGTPTYTASGSTLAFDGFETLQGGSDADVFDLIGDGLLMVNATVKGGSGSDTFQFGDGVILNGDLDGEGGADTLNYSSYSFGLLVALSGSTAAGYGGTEYTGIAGTFAGIDMLIGSADVDYLVGEDAAGTWTFSGTRTYKRDALANALTFSSFEDLQGGNQADLFDVFVNPGVALKGGDGNDRFRFQSGATSSGPVLGEAGTDTLDLSPYSTARTVTLASAAAIGFSGTDGVSAGFSGIDAVVGGTGSNILNGLSAGTWNLSASPTYVSGGQTLGFSSFRNLNGGSGVDTFNVQVSATANLAGGGGNDNFVFSDGAVLTGSATGGNGTDTLNMAASTVPVSVTLSAAAANGFSGSSSVATSFAAMDSVIGGSASDTLNGLASGTWNLSASPTYVSGGSTLSFTSFQALNGGTGVDTFNVLTNTTANLSGGGGNDDFVFANGATLTGSATGGAGIDTLNIGAYTTSVTVSLTLAAASGFSGTSSVATGFAAIDVVVGGSAVNTLNGLASGTWNLSASPTYVSGGQTLSFSAFRSLNGGSGVDQFNVTAATTANLNGGGGNDNFVFGDGVALSGSITGGSGTDTLNMAAYTTPVSVSLSSAGANGFSGTTTAATSFSAVDAVIGGSASDTLSGLASGTWTLAGTNTYVSGGSTLTFSSFQSLQGGSGADTFNVNVAATADLYGNGGNDYFAVADGVALNGLLSGGPGSDTFSLAAYTTNVTATLTGSTSDGFSGSSTGAATFSGIDSLTAGGGANNTIVGENVASTWTVSGAGSTYHDGSYSLSVATFQTYEGGSAADTFNVTSSAAVTLKGGAGADVFNLSNGAAVDGTISGDGGLDTLNMGAYTTPTYVALSSVHATNGFAGDATGAAGGISGIDVVTGGSGGSDVLTGLDAVSAWTLAGSRSYDSGGRTLAFGGFDILQGGSAADTFTIEVNVTVDLYGGDGDDTFIYGGNGLAVTGVVDGENGTDTLDYSGYTAAVTVDLSTGSATGLDGFYGIESLLGGDGADVLYGSNEANTWNILTTNTGVVTGLGVVSFASFAVLHGGAAADVFSFTDGSGITGSISGGGGTDRLDFSAYGAARGVTATISANNAGTIASPAASVAFGFSSIESFTGGAGNDAVVFGAGRTLSGTVAGGGGVDTLDYASYVTSVRVDLSTGAAIGIGGNVAGAVTGFENVVGGSGADILIGDGGMNVLTGNGGNDILVGKGGNDTLNGGDGRDILIGGGGADALSGGLGEDILIAGSTAHDDSIAALSALMSEWGRTDADYATRIAHLNGTLSGGRNGTRLLNGTTVFNDAGAVDTLMGGGELDWFIDFVGDLVTDLNTGGTETRTTL